MEVPNTSDAYANNEYCVELACSPSGLSMSFTGLMAGNVGQRHLDGAPW